MLLYRSSFYPDSTSRSTKPYTADMMFKTDFFYFHEDPRLDAHFLKIPMKGDEISIVFVQPRIGTTNLDAIESQIDDILNKNIDHKHYVDVFLPKLHILSDNHNLQDFLQVTHDSYSTFMRYFHSRTF